MHLWLHTAEIIFASPKINPSVITELIPRLNELNTLLSELGLNFPSRIIANEDFNGKILEPILLASGGISDTSELFLRSYQMYNMFSNKPAGSGQVQKIVSPIPAGESIDKLKGNDNNYPRYYSYSISIYGKDYLLSAQWVEHLHRVYYEKWLSNKL